MLDSHPDIYCGPELGIFGHQALYRQPFSNFVEQLEAIYSRCRWKDLDVMANLRAGFCPYAIVDEGNLPAYRHDVGSLRKLLGSTKDLDAFCKALFKPLLQRDNKQIWAEKTPSNLYAFEVFLERYSKGRVIYLVRDPRDQVCSLMRRGMSFRRASAIWLVETAICESIGAHPRALRVKFEELITDLHESLRRIFDFLEVQPAYDAVLRYSERSARLETDQTVRGMPSWQASPTNTVDPSAIGAWTRELGEAQLAVLSALKIAHAPENFGDICGITVEQLANSLGYTWEWPFAEDASILQIMIGEMFFSCKDPWRPSVFQERFVTLDLEKMRTNGSLRSRLVEGALTGASFIVQEQQQLIEELSGLQEEHCSLRAQYARALEEINRLESCLAEKQGSAKKKRARRMIMNPISRTSF